MSDIYYTEVVADSNSVLFEQGLNHAVNKAQEDGLTVDVQYAPTHGAFSALVIARKSA